MRVLVTGGKGYLGAELAKQLIPLGHDVICLDMKTTPGRLADVADHVSFLGGGIGDVDSLTEIMLEQHVDRVAHMVYIAGEDDPESLHREISTMVMGTADVFEAARRASVQRLFFPSSIHYYGPQWRHGDVWLDEEAPPLADTVYGISKRFNEAVAARYVAGSPLEIVSVRLPAIYGPGAKVGARGVNLAAVAAANGIRANLPYTSNQCICTAHVEDVTRCIVRVLLGERPQHLVYNVGGHATTYGEIAATVKRFVPTARFEFAGGPPSDLPYLIDDSRAGDELGLTHRSLEEGLLDVINDALRAHGAPPLEPIEKSSEGGRQ